MKIIVLAILLLSSFTSYSQQTVGLFYNTPESYNGYTLFAPKLGNTTYMIDNCGEKVQSWVSEHVPGNTVYLLENGVLLRTGNPKNPFFGGGGGGGIIEMIDWNSNVIWSYTVSDSTQCLHHDIEPLPNGNILALTWTKISKEDVLKAGYTTYPNDDFWSEKIIEIKPDMVNGGAEIVWEWHVWDHLVQDQDPNGLNYGSIESAELVDINFTKNAPKVDWLHFNSIDYNAKLDQIMVSNHSFSELWVIDHSTTTAEAKTHTGGKSGKGGDLIYRWGNPNAYSSEKNLERKIFLQHDPHWIADSLPDGGKIMIFNNQAGTPENQVYSTVNIIDPPVEGNSYKLDGKTFGPVDFDWTYKEEPATDFYALNFSGAQRLPNGNTLICNGAVGEIFEIDSNKVNVWKYIPPVGSNNKIGTQGEFITGNQIFRAERLSPNYPGLIGKDLTPQGYIETGSEFTCQLFDGTTNSVGYVDNTDIEVRLIDRTLNIDSKSVFDNVEIYNLSGNRISSFNSNNNHFSVSTNDYVPGVYMVRLVLNTNETYNFKFILE